MAELVSPVITPVVQSLMATIKKHLGYLVSSTRHVKQMDDKMKELNKKAEEVEATRDSADGNTEVIPLSVDPWLKDVENLNKRSDNLKESTGCFNLKKRYKVGKQSIDILEEIKDLKDRESKIVFTHEPKPLAVVVATSTVPSTSVPDPKGTDQIYFESRGLIFNTALQALQSKNESQKMIALCGMGGVGKTTMMEQLKKAVVDSNTFDLIVKVVIGENNDAMYLQKVIAEYTFGDDLTDSTKDARADRLQHKFKNKSDDGEKILIIMDDLWNEVDLKDLGLSPFPHGFKMLVTSRAGNVCTMMGFQILNIPVLSQLEAETLFSKTVSLSQWDVDVDVDELKSIGDEIVKECEGLPIAIVTIAKFLRQKKMAAWKMARFRLRNHNLEDLKRIEDRIFKISYENLEKDDYKAIFLLCGLFPDDFDICIEDLLRYEWGFDFFKNFETLARAREHMEDCVDCLIRANLVTESDVNGCVKMHDLVRAFVLNYLSEVKQTSILSNKNMSLKIDANKPYERILLKCKDLSEIPRVFSYSELSLFILMDGRNHKFFEDIFERTKKLKVVSCENLGIPLPPVMFEHSTKLQTVRLRSCVLIDSDISFLGSLNNLEILSLVDCNIRRLPSTIGKLKKLKLLDLNGCVDLHIDDGVFQNLKSLQELYLRASKGRFVKFTYANCDELREISQRLFVLELEFIAWTPLNNFVSSQDNPQQKNMSFKNLERFEISIGCKLDKKTFENYSLKNKLNVVATSNELQDCNIDDLFKRTKELNLKVNGMYNLEDISRGHTFCQLRVFHVSNCENLTCLFTPDMARGLKKLERLTISKCPVLEEMVGNNSEVLEVITFPKLNFMSLEDLPMMVTLCEDIVIKLPELVELRLCGLPKVTSMYLDNNSDMSAMQSLLNTEVMMPKLEVLDISNMKNLMQIWPCKISTSDKNDVSTLKQILVRKCDSLINLFPSNPLPLLNHLEELEVKNCGSIEVLFNIDFECVGGMMEYNSKLRIIKVKDLGKINELWRMRGVNHPDIVISGFKGVQKIEIVDCQKFTNIFTPITTNFNLDALASFLNTSYRERTSNDVEESIAQRNEEINMTYPSHLLHKCQNLQHLKLNDDKRVKEVFEMDSHQPLLFLYLESLVLTKLKEMNHVWRCNWNKNFSILAFQNLTKIRLWGCPKLKYLFSPLMAKYLSNLKNVHIARCYGIEEIISSRDDENEDNTPNQNTTFFPNLKSLDLGFLDCLKKMDGHSKSDQVRSLCQCPIRIEISSCDALSSLVPWYSVRKMIRLEELEISCCNMMKEVFESESGTMNNNVDEGRAPAGTTLVVPQLTNLKIVKILYCDLLSHVFTFSTLESLKQLEKLRIARCKSIQVIVKEENIETSSKDAVILPRLKKLELDSLPNLKGFFLGKNEFRWPLLDDVFIDNCPQLMVFTSGHSKTPKLKYIHTDFGKYSVEGSHGTVNGTLPTRSSSDPTISEETPGSFHNLIQIYMKNYFGRTIIPSNVLSQLEKLKKIELSSCSRVAEVFEAMEEGSDFNESQTTNVVEIPNLTQVNLELMLTLKYIWKNNRSMVLKFPNLTTLHIDWCTGLEHVFTCSMLGGLVQLQDLEVKNCKNIEVIVKEEDDSDGKVNLPCLKSLKLEFLPRLKGFCLGEDVAFSLPTLDTLQIKTCGSITVFTRGDLSTPQLKYIDTNLGMFAINHGDLNSFILTNQQKLEKEEEEEEEEEDDDDDDDDYDYDYDDDDDDDDGDDIRDV